MRVELITTGDEITTGTILNTNAQWLSEQLTASGFQIVHHASVPDDPQLISAALLAARGRSEAVIVTGGLGATTDDITLEVAAKAFGVPLVLNHDCLNALRLAFAKMGRSMTPNNERQAMIPEGGVPISNEVGSAPGCIFLHQGVTYYFLPGVPREMKPQFDRSVLPHLVGLRGASQVYGQRVLRCFGLPEAEFDQRLRVVDLTDVRLSFRVRFPETLVKVAVADADAKKVEVRLKAAAATIYAALGDHIYGEEETGLPEVVGSLLKKKGLRLAVAESCTGGRIANIITDVPGSSEWFERGVVCYSNRSKEEILKVPQPLIAAKGAVSEEVARALATGIRELAQVDIGVGVTGIAGPDGGTSQKPVGTVFIAIAAENSQNKTFTRRFSFPFPRDWFKQMTAYAALDLVRRTIL